MALQILRESNRKIDNLERYVLTVANDDLPYAIQAVVLNELNDQAGLGNRPSNVQINGKGARITEIDQRTRRVQIFFVDAEVMKQAARVVLDTLRSLYVHKTGQAFASIQIWGSVGKGKAQRLNEGGIDGWLDANAGPGARLSFVGPDVPHRRALYYGPVGTKSHWVSASRAEGKRVSGERQKQRKDGSGGKRQYLVQQTVAEKVKAVFGGAFGKSVFLNQNWMQVPVPQWSGSTKGTQGVPAVTIGWRKRGAT